MLKSQLRPASAFFRKNLFTTLMITTAVAGLTAPAHAQEQDAPDAVQGAAAPDDDFIIVSGTRQTIQNSIETKRAEAEIVDSLSSDEIGDLPALSIGEALETLTGAASHREQGGATEIAIRGLGPFLGSTVVNGRAASNGSGDRSVNFSQFPSELFNKVGIYKTQSASLIEGGVAGQITLETVKPIDYGKRRFQGDVKLNYNPDNNDIAGDQRYRTLGYRGTFSYIDQYEVGGGELGVSLGYSRNVQTNPEQEANVSNTLNYCRNVPGSTTGVFGTQNCDSPIPAPTAANFGEPFVIAQNSYSYRQNITDDKRDSFFGALQYKPTPDIDINMDFQYSNRDFVERRSDLVFAEGRRIDGVGDPNRLNFDLIVGPNGELLQFTNEQRIESISEYSRRGEKYYGGGLAVDVQASDRLKLSFDASYSETKRREEGAQVRLQSEARDIFGNPTNFGAVESGGSAGTSINSAQRDRIETATLVQQNGSDIFNFVVQNFDPNNYALFSTAARARVDLDQKRFNSIMAFRGDAEYEFDGFLSSIEAGVRYQELKYRDVPGAITGISRIEQTYTSVPAVASANQLCRTEFPESGFLSAVTNGNPLITMVNSAGVVTGTTNTYATFDTRCLLRVLEAETRIGAVSFDENGDPIFPEGNLDSISNNNVTEEVWAGYVQANFDSDLGSVPIRGNVGLRVVQTKVDSTGFRGTLNAVFDPVTGELTAITENQNTLTAVSGGGKYTEFLPSFNFVADIQPDLVARFAVFRALSRPDPSSLGFGRTFNALAQGEPVFSIADAVGTASASGNPFTSPLLSWNFDAAIEWYPNEDTILAVGGYYKRFNGGFETVGQFETFVVDGQPLDTIVTTVDTRNESSTIHGVEVTAAHRFSYLPQPFDGLGFKLSYNYAKSNFEFEDDTLGAIRTIQSDGSVTVRPGLIPPAEIFGLSKHVLSAQLYYQIGKLDLQGVYKYRSNYFQQFVDSPGRIRYVDDTGVFEARISYALTKQIKFTLEGINIFNEPRTNYRGTIDNLSSVQVFGPRYFAGVKVKF